MPWRLLLVLPLALSGWSAAPDPPAGANPTAPVALEKILLPSLPVEVGADALFLIAVRNDGPAPTAPVVVDPLPEGLAFVSALARRGEVTYEPAMGRLVWRVDTLAASEAAELWVTTRRERAEATENCAFVVPPPGGEPPRLACAALSPAEPPRPPPVTWRAPAGAR